MNTVKQIIILVIASGLGTMEVKTFQERPSQIRSVIAGLLCTEIERKWRMKGVKQSITCGRKPDSKSNCLEVVDKLIAIKRKNVVIEVHRLLMDSY